MDPAEWEWEALSATAFGAYEAARSHEARHLWVRAFEVAANLPADDPRRAASASNFGIKLLLEGRMLDARAALQDALGLWDSGLTWIDTMEMPASARSSLFHLRMEQRHSATYLAFRRSRNKDILRGSIALTKFNLALVKYHLDLDDEADQLLEESVALRRASCGGNDSQFVTMLGMFAARLETLGRLEEAESNCAEARQLLARFSGQRISRWTSECPRELCDQRRLLGAAHLTASVNDRDVV